VPFPALQNLFRLMEEYSDHTPSDILRLPMVPIRDVVIFPFTKVAFKIGRPGSVRALEDALATDRTIFLATPHDASIDEPNPDHIYTVGTVAPLPTPPSSPPPSTTPPSTSPTPTRFTRSAPSPASYRRSGRRTARPRSS